MNRFERFAVGRMFRKLLVPGVLVIAVIFALISLGYPSIVASNTSTQTIAYLGTFTSGYAVNYQQISASTAYAGYSISTAWYPGNPICDPASNACTPFPTPTATFTYPQSATYTIQITLSSLVTSLLTTGFTTTSIQTSFQNVPPYAAVGLTELQFGIVALILIAIAGLSVLFLLTRKRDSNTSQTE